MSRAPAQIEQDEYLETFQSYRHRYRMDYEATYSDDPLYYSVDIGRESFLDASHCVCPWTFPAWLHRAGGAVHATLAHSMGIEALHALPACRGCQALCDQ